MYTIMTQYNKVWAPNSNKIINYNIHHLHRTPGKLNNKAKKQAKCCKEANVVACHDNRASKICDPADLDRLVLRREPWGRSSALWNERGLQAPDTRVLLEEDSCRLCRLKLLNVSESGEAAVTRVSLSESKVCQSMFYYHNYKIYISLK